MKGFGSRNRYEEKQGAWRRSVLPALIVLAVAFGGIYAYNNLWRVAPGAVTWYGGHVLAAVVFISVGLGPFFIYPRAYRGGAGPVERIAACLVVPVVYALTEVARATGFFTLAEAVYYGLNTAILLIVLANLAATGVADMLMRKEEKGRRPRTRVLTAWNGGAVVLFLVGVYMIFLWGMGVHAFYIYQEGYKALFG
ncbi:MAG: hypothetical protein ACLFOY_16110 [Desulfatibacillaceae bacterium]